MKIGKLITGVIMCIIGAVLSLIPIFSPSQTWFLFEIYGISILVIGIFILFNKEDTIEKIKTK
jgi:membrane-bound ClpP family serine protease